MKPIRFVSANSPSLLSLLLIMAVTTTTMAAVVTPRYGCTTELTEMSACLPYISSPPNNLSCSASSSCCSIFNSAFDTGSATCLCHLVHHPFLLGFPLNTTRIFSLSSVCPPNSTVNLSTVRISLEHFCTDLPPLPSLESLPDSVPDSSPSPSPLPSSSSESIASSPPPSLSAGQDPNSSTLIPIHGNACQFLPGWMLFTAPIVAYLY